MAFVAAAIVLVGCLAVAAAWDIGRRVVATKRTPALLELREELTAKIEALRPALVAELGARIDVAEAKANDASALAKQQSLQRLGGGRR